MLQTSYEAKTKDLWVFIETKDGKARNVGLELLNPGRRLAGIQGGKTVALVIGYNCDEAVKEAIAHGADKVLVVDNEVYDHYSTDAYTAAIVHCVEADCPTTILMGASPMGRDLGPRVAGRLKTGLTADCTSLDIDEATGKVAWTRPAFGGNLMATILCPFTFPQIGTCRPGVNKKLEADYSRTAEVEKVDFVFPADQIRIKVIETIAEEGEKVDLEGADIIVSGGRGLGGPEGFETTIKPLADALGAVVGASRAAVDAGWIPHSHQVGQTGKTVGPKLYVACGISGAIQHLAGMGSSDFIVAINKDAEAPIFGVADQGVIGNLYDVCPALTKLILADKD